MVDQVQEAKKVHEELEKELRNVQDLQEDLIWPINRLLKELKSEESTLDQLQSQLSQDLSSDRILEDVDKDLEEQEENRKFQEQERSKLQELSLCFMRFKERKWKLQKRSNEVKSKTEFQQDLRNEVK